MADMTLANLAALALSALHNCRKRDVESDRLCGDSPPLRYGNPFGSPAWKLNWQISCLVALALIAGQNWTLKPASRIGWYSSLPFITWMNTVDMMDGRNIRSL